MRMRTHGSTRLARLLLVVALALAAAPSPGRAQALAYEIDPEHSSLHVVTRRAGALGFLGHDHAILATDWSARLCYAPEDPTASRARVTVTTDSLVIDTDAALAQAGLSSRPDPETVAELRERMLGPAFLDAAAHPEIRFEGRSVSRADDGGLVIAGPFHLHGEARALRIPVDVEPLDGNAVRFRAGFTQRMSDYGIRPESTLGVVAVADAFEVVLDVVARPGSTPCP